MKGIESSDSQSDTSEHNGPVVVRLYEDHGQDLLNSQSELDDSESQHLMERRLETRSDFYLSSGCPLGNRCPFKENAVQAWNITKDMADQHDEVIRLKNEIMQLKNINEENKLYIEALRANEGIMKRKIDQQQEELLEKRQDNVSLRLQIGKITKAAMSQLATHQSARSTPSFEGTIETVHQSAQSVPLSPPMEVVTDTVHQPACSTPSTEMTIETIHQSAQSVPLSPPMEVVTDTVHQPARSTPSTERKIETVHQLPLSQPMGVVTDTVHQPACSTPSTERTIETTHQSAQSVPLSPPMEVVTDTVHQPACSTPSTERTIETVHQSAHPTQSITYTQIRKKMILLTSSIFNTVFFDELRQQTPIEYVADFVLLDKQQRQFSINEVAKIIHQERVPGLAIHRISKKIGVSKSQATLLYTECKRNEKGGGKRRRVPSDDEDSEGNGEGPSKAWGKEKYQNPKALMPWRPYKRVLPPDMRTSALSAVDHRNYVAILQNMLKSTATFRFEHDLKKIKAWDAILEKERQLFLETALRTVKSSNTYPNSFCIFPGQPSLDAVTNHQLDKSRFQLGGRQFQGILRETLWTNSQQKQQSVALRFNISVLQPGNCKPLRIPDTRHKFMIKPNYKNIRNKIYMKLKQKVPITDDAIVRNLAFQNDIEILMDGSTLRHFLSAPYGQNPQTSYACRVSVELEFSGGKMRKICSVLPPMIASRMHRPFIVRESFKWALKLALSEGERNIDSEKGQKKPKMDECAESLLDELQLGDIGETAGTSATAAAAGKRYAIVEFGAEQQEAELVNQHRVLIRTNVHGTENARVVSLSVRPEFLPEIAAEKRTSEEVLMDLVTATLKGSEEHITLRMHFDENVHQLHLMQIDRKVASDWSRLDQDNRKLLSSRIQRLCTLLDSLREQDAGQYLLIHDDETIRLVAERNVRRATKKTVLVNSDGNDSEDLGLCIHEEEEDESATDDVLSSGPVYDFEWFKRIANMKPIFSHMPIEEYWNGIDPHYPLQWHIVRGQIPGALFPGNQWN